MHTSALPFGIQPQPGEAESPSPSRVLNLRPTMKEGENREPSSLPTESEKSASVEEMPVDEDEKPVNEEASLLLTGSKLALVFCSFMASFFLIALDQTIISTALPTIASHFQAVADLSWIASAYFLPQAAFMLFVGKLLSIIAPKPIFLASIGIFEAGSLLCAVAPSVNVLILGRAIAGVGASGLWISIMSIIAQITTMAQRPVLMGLFGAVYAMSSITGPLLGGVFADKVSWRWCFYINLPIGAVAALLVFLLLPYSKAVEDGSEPLFRKFMRLDWMGTFLSVSVPTMLLLALQWGGNERPWDDPAVISTLVLFGVLLPVLIFWEYKQGQNAVLLLNLFTNKSMLGACLESFMVNMGFTLANYYLPFLYQVKGHSATRSGIDIIPFMVSGVVVCLIAGGVIAKNGRPWPWLFFSPFLASIAFGLLFTARHNVSFAKLAGYQVLAGFGLGPGTQNPLVVAQGIFADRPGLVPQATATVTFVQLIGSALGLSIAQAIFSNQLRSGIDASLPDLPPQIKEGVLASIKFAFSLPEEMRDPILRAYTAAVANVFILGVPAAALASAAALLITRGRIVPKAAKSDAVAFIG